MAGIKIELQMEDGSFTSGMLRARQSMSDFRQELARLDPHYRKLARSGRDGFISMQEMDRGTTSLLGRLRDLTVVGAGAAAMFSALSGAGNGVIGNIVRLNAEMEKLKFQLAGMSTAADPMKEAGDQVAFLQTQAKTAPFALDAITSSFVKLKVAGLDPMGGSLRSLLDGLAAFGGSDEQLERVTLGLSQMAGKGVIQMEELRQQLGEGMPSAMKLMARSMGVSVAELTRAIATGRVEARAALGKWFEQVDLSFGGSAEAMMATFSGQMARLKTAFTKAVTEGGMGEAFEGLKAIIGDVATALEGPDAAKFFDAIGRGLVGAMEIARSFVNVLKDMKPVIEFLGYALPVVFAGAALRSAVGAAISLFGRWNLGIMSIRSSAAMAGKELMSMTQKSLAAQLLAQGAIQRSAYNRAKNAALANGLSPEDARKVANRDESYKAERGVTADLRRRETEAATRTQAANVARGVRSSLVPAFAVLRTVASAAFGPITLGLLTMGPLIWAAGKGLWDWWRGAKSAREEISKTASAIAEASAEARRAAAAELSESNNSALTELETDFEGRQAPRQRLVDTREGQMEALAPLAKEGNQAAIQEMTFLQTELEQIRATMLADEETYQAARADLLKAAGLNEAALARRQATEAEDEREARDRAEIQAFRAQIQQRTREARNAFNLRAIEIEETRDRELEAEQANGGTGALARERAATAQRENEAALYAAREAAGEQQLGLNQLLVDSGEISSEAYVGMLAVLDEVTGKLEETKNKTYAIELLTAPVSEEKKIERLVRYLDGAQEKVRELGAEINGASGALAKLMYQVNRGDFGNLKDGSAEARQLRYALVEATVAQEALSDMMNTSNDYNENLERTIANLEEQNLQMEFAMQTGRRMSDEDFDVEFLLWRGENDPEVAVKSAEELILRSLQNVTAGTDSAISAFNEIHTILSTRAFSPENIAKVNTMTEAVGRLAVASQNVADNFSGFTVPDFNVPGQLAGVPPGLQANKGVLDLIANAEGTEGKPRSQGYNTTLDYGRWTGGEQDLVNMTLSQILDLQKRMLDNPENRMTYGDGKYKGSSALGRYQVVSTTLKEAIAELGLDMDQNFDEATQDRIAMWILNRALQNGTPIGKVWVGVAANNLEAQAQSAAREQYPLGAAVYDNLSPGTQGELDASGNAIVERTRRNVTRGRAAADDSRGTRGEYAMYEERQSQMEELEALQASDEIDDSGRSVAALMKKITSGTFGDIKDPNNEIYADLLDTARQMDALRAKAKDDRQAEGDILRMNLDLAEQELEIADRAADAIARRADPNFRGQSSDLRDFDKDTREYLAAVEKRYTQESDQYRAAMAERARIRAQLLSAEGEESLLSQQTQADELERAAMSEKDRRRADLADALDAIAADRDQTIAANGDKLEAERQYFRARKALLDAYTADNKSAMRSQIEGMSDLGDNLKNRAGDWSSALSDALYTGDPDDFDQLGLNIREGIARAFSDKAASIIMRPIMNMLEGESGEGGAFGMIDGIIDKIMGGIGGGGGDKLGDALGSIPGVGGPGMFDGFFASIKNMFSGLFSGGAGGAGGGFMSWLSSIFRFGTAHTGAILGKGFGGSVSIPAMAFANAPRYHTGGIIDGKSMGLKSNEVPLVGLKGEGVFTKDQMKHLAGTQISNAQSISMAPVIHVNANGGTPEQNADLAKQISGETERAMRNVVRDELIRQQRPGNPLSRR